jgi:hypothetical protein
MNKSLITFSLAALLSLVYISCGTSTGSRYERVKEKVEKPDTTVSAPEIKKVFDMTPYRAEIIVPEPEKRDSFPKPEIWYTYTASDNDTVSSLTIIAKKDGYRVQVFSTDNLDEANTMRSELLFKTNQKNVYLVFEPPFYKIKLGDFLNITEANQMNFKLNQMGYTESRVVKDSFNVYQ